MSAIARPQGSVNRPREKHIEFAVSRERLDAETAVVSTRGEVDLYTAPAFARELAAAIEAGASRIVVDLTDTTFLDSSGLDVLVAGRKRLTERGGRISVVCTAPNIRKVFEITRLDRLFPIHGAIEQALAAEPAPA